MSKKNHRKDIFDDEMKQAAIVIMLENGLTKERFF
jgi:hypothetical protein